MFQVPGEFLVRLREPLDWIDVRYAYENQLVDGQVVIDFARRALSETDAEKDEISAIASAKKSDQLMPLLERVAGTALFTPETARKWALILAAFVGESDAPNRLDLIEEVYASFDYPSELAGFIRYMPMKGPDLGSVEANENRMLDSLKSFAMKVVAPT